MNTDQAGVDAQYAAEELRAEALALIANHPPEHRGDLEDRLLSMSTSELRGYLAQRRAFASWKPNRDRRYYQPYEACDLGPVPERFVEIPEYDHDRERDGIDPRMFGNDVDHPYREAS